MGFYRRPYTKFSQTNANTQDQVNDRVTDPAIGGRLTALLGKSDLSAKDREFITSLDGTWKRFANLSTKQYNYMQVVEQRYDPAAVAANASARAEWEKTWDAWKIKQFHICCEYYRQTEYFRDLAVKGLTDKTFIPTEKQFRAMCENKYAQRLVHNMTNNKFEINDTVEARKNRFNQERLVGVVVGIEDTITRRSANIGGRIYRIMWMSGSDAGEEMRLEEKELKVYRHKD